MLGAICLTQPQFLFHNVQLGYFGKEELAKRNCIEQFQYWMQNNTIQNKMNNGSILGTATMNSRSEIYSKGLFINDTLCDQDHLSSQLNTYIGYIMIVLTGLGTAVTTLFVRGTKVGELTCDIQLTWTHCLALCISAILMSILEKPTLPKDMYESLSLAGHVFFSFTATVSYYAALNITSGVLVHLAYAPAVVFSLLSQYLIVSNIKAGHRNVLEIVGVVLVFVAACINPLYHIIRERREQLAKQEGCDYELE